MSLKDVDVVFFKEELRWIRTEVQKTNAWMDAFANASMWTHIFQIAGLVLLALILWRVW